MSTPRPNIPMENAGNLYINGLKVSVGATSLLLSVSPGQARDSTNTNDIFLPGDGVTPAATIINAANNGLNGLDTGTIDNDLFYAVYVIGSSLYGNISPTNPSAPSNQIEPFPFNYKPSGCILSLSFVRPVLPEGYDMFRRIGVVLTGGAATILPFEQLGGNDTQRWTLYDTPLQELNAGAAAAWADVDCATSVPIGPTMVRFSARYTPTGAGDVAQLRINGSASTIGNAYMTGTVAGVVEAQMLDCPCDANRIIEYQNVGTLTLYVAGFLDNL